MIGQQTVHDDIQILIASLASNDPAVRQRSREALVHSSRAAVIPLIAELESPSSRVCWEAAKALGEIKDPAAATALAENLSHHNGDVRWATANALIALGAAGLKQTLTALLTKASSVHTRQAAQHVISHFAHLYLGEHLLPLLMKFHAYEPGVAIPPAALHVLHEMETEDLSL
jgi:HEAT repeat protein